MIYEINDPSDKKIYYFETYSDCIISDHIKKNQIWEPHLHAIFEQYINKDSIVLEAGCYIGTHTIKLASLAKLVYAFEPLPKSNQVLQNNIKLNKINNVILSNKGLADQESTAEFGWVPDWNPGGATLDNNPMGKPDFCPELEEKIKIELTTIDSLNLEKLDFIKLDVEGYEPLAIKGALKTIEKYKPIIVLECWSSYKATYDIEFTKDKMKDLIALNYEIKHLSGPDFICCPA